MWRSRSIDGSATFTTVLSSMIMNSPNETAASVHHFRFSSAKTASALEGSVTVLRVREVDAGSTRLTSADESYAEGTRAPSLAPVEVPASW